MSKRGFTIIEILVVVGIIAVLTAAAIPMYNRARLRSSDTKVLDAWREACERLGTYKGGGGADLSSTAAIGGWLSSEGFSDTQGTLPQGCSTAPSGWSTTNCLRTKNAIQSGNLAIGDITINKGSYGKCWWDPNSNSMKYTDGGTSQ
jgi:prepilin-type N-terminal cleavage/methylation domain-containing protein